MNSGISCLALAINHPFPDHRHATLACVHFLSHKRCFQILISFKCFKHDCVGLVTAFLVLCILLTVFNFIFMPEGILL